MAVISLHKIAPFEQLLSRCQQADFIEDAARKNGYGREDLPELSRIAGEVVRESGRKGSFTSKLLQEEAELEEIVKMVGMDALSPSDRLKMEAARSIREDFLHQNSFHEVDTYTSLKKQHMMMVLVNEFFDRATDALKDGASLQKLISMPVREQIGRFKYVTEDKLDEEFKQVDETLSAQIAAAFVKEEG